MARIFLSLALTAVAVTAMAGCAENGGTRTETASGAIIVDRFVLQPLTIEVMIKPNTSQPDIDALLAEIEERDDVDEVVYTSQEDALEILRKRLGDDQDLLPPDLAWELSPTFEIAVEEDADIRAIAGELAGNEIVDNSPGTHDGVSYEVEAWRLELRDDDSFLLRKPDGNLKGNYKIFRDSITLIEETGEYGVFEGEITGTTIKFEAFPGTWEKE